MAAADIITEYGRAQDRYYWGEYQGLTEEQSEPQDEPVRRSRLAVMKRRLPSLLIALALVIVAIGVYINSIVMALVFAVALSVVAFFIFLGRDWYYPGRPPYGGLFIR